MPQGPMNLPRFSAAELMARITTALGHGLSASAQVGLELGPEQPLLRITRWHYKQRLHEPWRLELEASGGFIADPTALLWQGASFWQRDGLTGFHALNGRVRSITEAGDSTDLCHYRFALVSSLEVLDFSRRSRVFQRVTSAEVAQSLLSEHGLGPVELREIPPLPRWRHLSQSRDALAPHQFETDLHFIRRILADAGLSLWLEPDDAGERIVIGRAGLGASSAKPLMLPLATPSGLDSALEHLADFELHTATAPNIARLWAYNYRDQGRSLRAEFEADPQAPLGLGEQPSIHEEPAYGADALVFDGNDTAGVQSWLDDQARLLGQRHQQQRLHLQASSNAAGLWRCGQTLQLGLQTTDPMLDSLWLLTAVQAGSHLGPWLEALSEDTPPDGSAAHVHFEASPVSTWVERGWMPERLATAPLNLEHARISATPGATYAYLDKHGRYQVDINADEQASPPGGTSRPVRHIRSHAGPDYGWHLPLHENTEVLLAFHGGHADTPMIARALHNSRQPDHVSARNASRNVLRTWANNKLRLEDRQEQEHIKLSTEYGLSQLNLGHHVTSQGHARGEGFELRTQHWGALRARQGLLLSTFAGQPRGTLGDARTPAHQRYNPGASDAQGAQAMSEQRSQANEQVGLGKLEALASTKRVAEHSSELKSSLIHAASAQHLALLTPASQVLAAHEMSFAAQGSLELASEDQIRFYAKAGITWHTEGADKVGAGQGGSRTDVISHGSDQTQVRKGQAKILGDGDVVMEFRGETGSLIAKGASLVLTQAGVLTITGNVEVISEAPTHQLGGALDWRAGSGVAATGPLNWWGQMYLFDDESPRTLDFSG